MHVFVYSATVLMCVYNVSSLAPSLSSALTLPIPKYSAWWRLLHSKLEEEERLLRVKVGCVLKGTCRTIF